MNRMLVSGVACGLICVVGGSADASEAEATVEALKLQYEQVDGKRREVDGKLRARRDELARLDSVKQVREAASAVDKAYRAAIDADKAVEASMQARADADAAFRKVVAQRLAVHAGARTIAGENAALYETRMDLEFQKNLARFNLIDRYSPVQRKLSVNPEVMAARDAERKAESDDARDKARKRSSEVRNAILKTLPEAKALMTEIEGVDKKLAVLRETESANRAKLDDIRRTIERDESDPGVAAAMKLRSGAGSAVRAAENSEALKAEKQKRDEARRTYETAVNDLLKADPAAAALIEEVKALQEQTRELRAKMRAASQGK